MAFLIKEELKTVAPLAIIDKIINSDNDIVSNIIDESISLMKGYMSRHYDVEAIFSKQGNERHKATLKRLKDICIYEIYESHTREQNATAARRYNEALDLLEKLNTGEFSDKTLPPKPPATPENTGLSGEIRFGGNKRYTSVY